MSTDEPQAKTKPKRSPLERLVVWGFILLLAIVVGLEYRGMTGYSQSLDALETVYDKRVSTGKAFPLEEAKGLLKLSPSLTKPVTDGTRVEVTAKWFTVLSFMPDRTYEIHLGLDKVEDDAYIRSITTAANRQQEKLALNRVPANLDLATPVGNQIQQNNLPPARQRVELDADFDPIAEAETAGLDLGVIAKLLDPEVQQDLGLSDEQAGLVADLKGRVSQGVSEIAGAKGMRPSEMQPVMDGFMADWLKDARDLVGDEGMDTLKQLTESP